MRTVPIELVKLDSCGNLQVFPETQDSGKYALIYRDATGVGWNAEERYLYPKSAGDLTCHEWFEIILSAVTSEYGDKLEPTNQTRWENISNEVRDVCQEIAQGWSA